MTIQCCVCKKYKITDRTWSITDPNNAQADQVSHGLCPRCAIIEHERLKAIKQHLTDDEKERTFREFFRIAMKRDRDMYEENDFQNVKFLCSEILFGGAI